MRYIFIILCLFVGKVFANDINDLTKIYLEYSRSFHEKIEITIIVSSDESVRIVLVETPINSQGYDVFNAADRSSDFSKEKIVPILDFFENENYIQQFRHVSKKDSIYLDGSVLEISVHVNSYFEGVSAYGVFGIDALAHEKELARIALYIFNLIDLEIKEEDLY
jgi:hypothetical protein